MHRLFFNILSDGVENSKAFYVGLLEMQVHFDSDWFVILKPAGDGPFELGIIDKTHEITPPSAAGVPKGVYPTMVVDDVDVIYERARTLGIDVIEAPKNMFYGQRRMLVRDPDGLVVDISSLVS